MGQFQTEFLKLASYGTPDEERPYHQDVVNALMPTTSTDATNRNLIGNVIYQAHRVSAQADTSPAALSTAVRNLVLQIQAYEGKDQQKLADLQTSGVLGPLRTAVVATYGKKPDIAEGVADSLGTTPGSLRALSELAGPQAQNEFEDFMEELIRSLNDYGRDGDKINALLWQLGIGTGNASAMTVLCRSANEGVPDARYLVSTQNVRCPSVR